MSDALSSTGGPREAARASHRDHRVPVASGVFRVRDRAIVSCVSILVFVPSMLFALSLRVVPAMMVTLGCAGAYALVVSGAPRRHDAALDAPVHLPRLLLCIGLAFVLLLLGGETHVFFATSDWLTRDAVLSDLVSHGGLVAYRFEATDYVLRAPLGMYMIPALVGWVFGLVAAHGAMLVQNALFLGAIFYLLMALGRGWRHLAILVLFAGATLFGTLLRNALMQGRGPMRWLVFGLDSWNAFLQYSSSVVQFFWVPSHALPGWWLATLILLQVRGRVDVATLGVSVAGLSFWSPLAVLPGLPWLLYVAATAWRPVLLARRTWLGAAAAVCFVPLPTYLLLGSGSIAHSGGLAHADFAFWYAIFILVQLPALVFIAVCRRSLPAEYRALLVVNALILLGLPFFDFGPNNDLVMRGSIAALTIVAFLFGAIVIDFADRGARGAFVGYAIILLAAPSAFVEIGRALATPRFAISTCSLLEATQATGNAGVYTNYVARADLIPAWLADVRDKPRVTPVRQACWPDLRPPRFFGVTSADQTKAAGQGDGR